MNALKLMSQAIASARKGHADARLMRRYEQERCQEDRAALIVAEAMRLIDHKPRACQRVLACAWDRFVLEPEARGVEVALAQALRRYDIPITGDTKH